MHRFFLPPEAARGPIVELSGEEAHHAARVLRLRRGDPVAVLDGAGGELACVVADVAGGRVRLEVSARRVVPAPAWRLTLLQALPKGKLFESIVQKATELGVARIVPVLSERVIAQLDDRKAAARQADWQQVAVEACKQCGQAWLPRVEAPATPAALLARAESWDLPLVASLQPGSRHPRACFEDYRAAHGRAPASVCVWVGPEGDFTAAEIEAITAGGARPITLGPLVLRVETAAVYCLSVLNYELQAGGGH
ncbi:MAG: Ribosomal small subunit methyltransferase [Verrucomicrobiota bacterium]